MNNFGSLPLNKTGSTAKCENYRNCNLLLHASKIMPQLIERGENTRRPLYFHRIVLIYTANILRGWHSATGVNTFQICALQIAHL